MAIKGYCFIKDAYSDGTPGALVLTFKVFTDDGVVQEVQNSFVTPLTLTPIRTWAFQVMKDHSSQIISAADVFILNSPT